MKGRVTLKDIAAAAGVSASTVSLVLNGKIGSRVSAATVAKIRDIAENLHYQPDINAQRLKGKALPIIGLVVPNITNYFYSEMTKGIMDAGANAGYNVILLNSENTLQGEQLAAEAFLSVRVAGAIICGVCEPGTEESVILEELKRAGIPVVKIDRCEWNEKYPRVMIDNYQAAYDSVKCLHRLGHRKIGIIATTWDLGIMNAREQGYQQAMKDLDLEISESMIYRKKSYDLTDEEADEIADDISKHLNRHTAILAIPGDVLAIECIVYWKRHGINVPDDISIMGFDNVYMGSIIEPALTTVDQPKYEMGKGAMELLIKAIEGRSGAKRLVYQYQIIERNSVRNICASE